MVANVRRLNRVFQGVGRRPVCKPRFYFSAATMELPAADRTAVSEDRQYPVVASSPSIRWFAILAKLNAASLAVPTIWFACGFLGIAVAVFGLALSRPQQSVCWGDRPLRNGQAHFQPPH